MTDSALTVKVVTPDKVRYEGSATSVVAPGSEGYLGILRNHAPFVTSLARGNLFVKNGPAVQTFKIEGGFLEVSKNRVLVLTDKINN